MYTVPPHIFCIIPPQIFEHLARHSEDRAVRAMAIEVLSADQSFRSLRGIAPLIHPASRADIAPAATPHRQRAVYTSGNTTGLPGTLVRSEGDPATGDAATDEAYDWLGATFDLYWNVYSRNSIDNAGLDLRASVHYGVKYDNAFWDGTRMVFGDGDGVYFNRFTIPSDVVGHELTHGVTGCTARLEYHDQPGALNESISDVFGSLVKQYRLGQAASQGDWLIGQGLFTATVHGVALRSMKAPGTAYDDTNLGKDPQPDHMSRYVNTTGDNGGVHINSGIPNRAFYLAAIALGGNAWEKAGRIWYATLTDPALSTTAQFADFANLTVSWARQLYNTATAAAVADAWAQVGIETTAASPKIAGAWILHYNWSPGSNVYSQASLLFNGNGTFGGQATGKWRQQDGTLLLAFDSGPAKYTGTLDGSIGTGAMSTFVGSDGVWYLSKAGTVGLSVEPTIVALGEMDAAGTKHVAPKRVKVPVG
jgi:hypothetical protein